MFGSPGPPAGPCSVVMKVGKFVSRLVCDSRIDDELSTMKRRSTLRLIDCWKVLEKVDSGFNDGFSRVRALQAQRTGATAARAAQRSTRNSERPVTNIGILLGQGRVIGGAPGQTGALKLRDYRESGCGL